IELLGGFQNIDEMVGNPFHLLLGNLGRANVHSAVDLHGIRRDNLPADLFGNADGKAGLSHSSGSGKNDKRFFHDTTVLNFFSSLYLLMEMIVGLPWGQL